MIDSQEMCLHCPAVNSAGSSSCHECGQQLAYEEVWLFGGSRHNTKVLVTRGTPSLETYSACRYIVANKLVFVHNGNSEEYNPYRYIFNQMKRYGFYKEMDEYL